MYSLVCFKYSPDILIIIRILLGEKIYRYFITTGSSLIELSYVEPRPNKPPPSGTGIWVGDCKEPNPNPRWEHGFGGPWLRKTGRHGATRFWGRNRSWSGRWSGTNYIKRGLPQRWNQTHGEGLDSLLFPEWPRVKELPDGCGDPR